MFVDEAPRAVVAAGDLALRSDGQPEVVVASPLPGSVVQRVENRDFAAFVRRIVRRQGRRVGAGDLEDLAELQAVARFVEEAMAEAVAGLRAQGYSWANIGAALGVTKQATRKRWGT